jgi:hypothetical protein
VCVLCAFFLFAQKAFSLSFLRFFVILRAPALPSLAHQKFPT